MARLCPRCGEENPDRFRVCGMCGADLGAEARSAEQVRKTVTVVFSDLKGSTALGEALDSESLREVLDLYFRAMRAVLERHGGTVEKYIGDAVMAVFGLPTAHEDDALRAVRAAFEMREALARVNENLEAGWGVRLENRTGVNTGEVVAGDVRAGQRLVTGDTVNTAARLEQAAPPLEVLLGESTYRLVRDAVTVEPVEPLELKGKAGRVPAYRLLSVRSEQGRGRRLDAPLVGRERELQTLLGSLSAAVAEGRPHLVTVLGEAGVGKSRLLREFQARAGESVLWLRGRCLSYGEGITFWPLAEVVRAAADVSDEDPREQARAKVALLLGEGGREAADRLAAAIGLADGTYPVQETFWAARRFVELLARRKPVVLQLEDLHWAEPTFLDLVRFVADPATRAPAVLVCSSRRELLEDHPEWEEEGPAARCLTLGPLSREESQGVVENLLGPGLDERFRSRIVQAADGNPLFVEQLVSMLVDEGAIERDSAGGWVVRWDPETIAVPPTISALLTARLDRLAPAERTVVERAAVIGQVFPRDAVAELVPEETRPEVGAALATLVRKDLVRPHEAELAGHEAYRFVHVLVRDAAYHGLLKRTRAELHERFVDWVEGLPSDRVVEHEEIRGYHLEQAYLTRVQLGPADGHTLAVGRRGARYLASAGRRAVARGDMPAAGSLLRRAAALLPPGHPERPQLLTEAGEALVETGELALAETTLATAIQ
ncbi:MAG TPA: adenylate/guanylate cyclase domain-containing protein, partial [Actinomycetota bacterium]|nr:adenylate/guanylate cyclase domain-containing protein [Actinomycetota bacterium]